MVRLATWLAAAKAGAVAGVGDGAGAACDGDAGSKPASAAEAFAPFFPLLGIWDEV